MAEATNPADEPLVKPNVAHGVALAVAGVVFLIGLVLLGWTAYQSDGFNLSDKEQTVRITSDEVRTGGEDEGTTTRSETTESEREYDIIERSLGSAGIWMLRLLLVILAAFLAGAAAQRVLLGAFAIKVGSVVEVPPLPPLTAEKVAPAFTGARVELQAQVKEIGPADSEAGPSPSASETLGAIQDPRIRLLTFVGELEGRLRALASAAGIDPENNLRAVVLELGSRGVINPEVSRRLYQLVLTGNAAARGVNVSESAGHLVEQDGSAILGYLDTLLALGTPGSSGR